MENFIIGLFSEQLSMYIKGFNKDQVNTNLLNGKGEVTDVHVNVDPINELLRTFTSLVELSSIYVSKLSFNVTSFRNIKKAPIEVSIDEVHVIVVESLSYQSFSEASWPDLAKAIVEKAKKSGPYGLLERIQDNITLDINRVYMTFQPMGKFKTRKIGPWTPPAISVVLNNFRFAMVDEFGNEGSPDDVWRHNSRGGKQEASLRSKVAAGTNNNSATNDRTYRPKTFMIYKKVSMELSLAIGHRTSIHQSAKDTFLKSEVLVANLPLQTHLCVHRDIRRKAVLAVQVDVSLMRVEVEIDPNIIPLLIHAMIGMEYCLAKDRSFTDPFKDDEGHENGSENENENENVNGYTTSNGEGDGGGGGGGVSQHDTYSHKQEDGEIDVDMSMTMSMDETYNDLNEIEEFEDSVLVDDSQHDTNTADATATATKRDEKWPAIVMPNGLIVMEKIALSLSINHIGVRVCYPTTSTCSPSSDDSYKNSNDKEGFLQTTMKGFMAELIWPKEGPPDRLGGYIQSSLAFASVQETLQKSNGSIASTRQIFLGGHPCVNKDDISGTETSAEEMFPMFESSMIRSDPVDLRSTFPVQLFGWKSSIDVLDKTNILSSTSQLSIMNEIGVNDVHFTFLPDVLLRLYAVGMEQVRSIDPRWNSGEWGPEAGLGDMDLQNCIQPLPIIETKTIEEFLSQVVNVTARICNFKMCITPYNKDTKDNLKCGTITCALSESTLIFSPSLPRLFFSEEIPSNAHPATFPNAVTDDFTGIALDATSASASSKKFRGQVTLVGASVTIEPTIPYGTFYDPKKLVNFDKLTILGSYELSEEEAQNANDGGIIINPHLFLSNLIQVTEVNVDFDNLACAVATAYSYEPIIKSTSSSELPMTPLSASNPMKPLNVVIRSSITRLDVYVWRQNMSLDIDDDDDDMVDPHSCALMLLHLNLEQAEFGFQSNGSERNVDALVARADKSHGYFRSMCAKGVIGKLQLLTTRMNRQLKSENEAHSLRTESKVQESSRNNPQSSQKEVLLSFGSDEEEKFLRVRLENGGSERACVNIAAEVSSGKVFASDSILHTVSNLMESFIHPDWEDMVTWRGRAVSEKSENVPQNDGHDIDWRLQLLSSVLQTEAHLLDFVNMRFQLKNIALYVPYKGSDNQLAVVMDKISLYTAYIRQEGCVPQIYNNAWESGVFIDRAPGFHHMFSSQQKFIVSRGDTGVAPADSTSSQELVKSFLAEFSYHPKQFWGSSSNFAFSLDELAVWEELQKTAIVYKDKVQTLKVEVEEAVALLMKPIEKSPSRSQNLHTDVKSSPFSSLCTKSLEEIRSAKNILEEAKISLLSYEKKFQSVFNTNRMEVESLHQQLFSQQKDLVAAFSLVSHRMSGFIKMSGTNTNGQRFISTHSFWEYFGVIRNDSFFLFKDTSQSKPIFIIPLNGAKLRTLTGSGAKRTFNRAFAIIGPSGDKSFFIARNYAEYEKWITALKSITPDLSESLKISAKQAEDTNGTFTSPAEDTMDPMINNDDQSISNVDDDNIDIDLNDASSVSGEVISGLQQHPDDSLHTLEDDLVSQYSSTFDEGEGEGEGEVPGGRGAKFRQRMSKFSDARQRMSKFSDAVKNVKLDKNAIRNRNGNPVFPRRQQGVMSKRDASAVNKVLRLKQVRNGNEEPKTKEMIKVAKGQNMVRFPGIWSIGVSIEILSNAGINSVELSVTESQPKKVEAIFVFDLTHDVHISAEKPVPRILKKELAEVIHFHTDLSKTLMAIENDPSAADLDFTEHPHILSHVVYSGKMLEGILRFLGDKCDEKPNFLLCVEKSTSAFFEALLSNPLPSAVSSMVAHFLDITNTYDTKAMPLHTLKTEMFDAGHKMPNEHEVFKLLDNCADAIVKAERQTNRAQTLTAMALKNAPHSIDSNRSGNGKPPFGGGFSTVLENALLSVMTERDEAHAQLVASRVLHTHEMDQQRRKTEILDSKLKFIEELDNQGSAAAAAFFLGNEKLPEINPMTKIEKEMVQSVDAELLALCRQLSSEISLKVAAELEIIRLKESRKIEREFEKNQRKNLELQLEYYKRKADEEAARSKAAIEEKEKWRQSFEQLLENDTDQ